jgi:2-polyprenyl-3-methyl-5-hydroxy-6-metoxy-1,4-benzoquinol methylase
VTTSSTAALDLDLEDVVCNLCGSYARSVIRPAMDVSAETADLFKTFSSSSSERLTRQLVSCEVCGLRYVSPRLKAQAVIEGYAEGTDEQFVSQARGREITFNRCLDLIERVWNRPPGRLLDIGTGGGSFPHVASSRGWKVEGCEPNRWLCEWSHKNYGLPIRPGTVFDQNYPSQSFDVVTLWDVLEHTPDPKKEIAEAHRLLAADGLLVINYPDIGSWIARIMGGSWVFLLDVHLYYFTRATITRLLEHSGFRVVTIRPHFQRLGLSYILHRATPYAGPFARAAQSFATALGIGERQVPYWMGQTLVIARTTSSQPPERTTPSS